jgi:hypothetical protein
MGGRVEFANGEKHAQDVAVSHPLLAVRWALVYRSAVARPPMAG